MNIKYHFPPGVRLWRWWCDNGLSNGSGGTIGGSFLMRLLQDFYSIIHRDEIPHGFILCDERKLFVDVLDLHMYQMVLPQLEQNDTEFLLAQTLTPPGGVFVDVGANVGILSLFALYDAVAAVHSFEPNPAMMSRLQKTRAASPFASHWHLYESAIGAASGSLSLYVDSSFSGTASLRESWQGQGAVPVEVAVTTLDFMRDEGRIGAVDVLKMDVEGWEHSVLEGAAKT